LRKIFKPNSAIAELRAGKNFYPVPSFALVLWHFPKPSSFLPACLTFALKNFGGGAKIKN